MQKMKKKKGFTLTELAIVIAVIAILIAVLVPTFVSLINSAKLSADEQAVKNMNTALTTSEATDGKPSNLADAQSVLSDAGFSTELIPTTSGYYYFWNSEYNIVLLLDLSDGAWDLIYPKTDDAEIAYSKYISCCYNLDAKGTSTDQTAILEAVKKGNNITITADGGTDSDEIYKFSDIVTLANTYGETFAGSTVVLSSNVTEYSGDPILNFQGTFTCAQDSTNNNAYYSITIAENGIVPVKSSEDGGYDGNGYVYYQLYDSEDEDDQKTCYGLFASVTNGGRIENLKVTYKDTDATNPVSKRTYYGGIVGFLDGGTISGCTVDGTIIQYNRVGGIVGTAFSGTIENCTVTANLISYKATNDSNGDYSNIGGIVAYAENKTTAGYIYVKNCIVGPDSGTMSITTQGYAGGITARITTGIAEFNITGTTIQNVTITTSYTYNGGTSEIGAVCGNLSIEDGLTGDISVKNVGVVNHYSSGNESSDGVKFLYYTTDSSHQTDSVYANRITRKTYSNKTLSAIGVSEYTIIVGVYGKGTMTNGLEYSALKINDYLKYTEPTSGGND